MRTIYLAVIGAGVLFVSLAGAAHAACQSGGEGGALITCRSTPSAKPVASVSSIRTSSSFKMVTVAKAGLKQSFEREMKKAVEKILAKYADGAGLKAMNVIGAGNGTDHGIISAMKVQNIFIVTHGMYGVACKTARYLKFGNASLMQANTACGVQGDTAMVPSGDQRSAASHKVYYAPEAGARMNAGTSDGIAALQVGVAGFEGGVTGWNRTNANALSEILPTDQDRSIKANWQPVGGGPQAFAHDAPTESRVSGAYEAWLKHKEAGGGMDIDGNALASGSFYGAKITTSIETFELAIAKPPHAAHPDFSEAGWGSFYRDLSKPDRKKKQ